ncbi:hypothetical protein BN1048_00145 [Jeotgalicoccus saudimassiliensis]|uniref:Inner membrane protein YhaI n=1 Tax=Jeotgalicoccus saudimassiliensis TaxID=1461582 RepID=A0A078M2E7_9STAP|nr:DUF805 domain-containing protein [Jeotgalicoccus saudimassiliensis]CDZ99026.1 hypothetical protein BN1048_00145 [Jeotgalicoccus saudimassiliensis]
MIIKSYIDFWKRIFDFTGRSTRSDFWVPFLTHIFIFLFFFYFGAIIDVPLGRYVVLITMVPSFTVTVRRLHDTNRTMLFAILFPISAVAAPIGGVVAFIGMFAWAGTGGTNTIAAVLIVSTLSLLLGVIIALYSLFLFILPGNKTSNKYGSGGSCVTSTTEI